MTLGKYLSQLSASSPLLLIFFYSVISSLSITPITLLLPDSEIESFWGVNCCGATLITVEVGTEAVMKAVIATILKHLANTHEYEMDQMNPVQN
jgi:hypothetical protein